jgi:hypothetical protein
VGYEMDGIVDIVTAERVIRPKAGTYVVHGSFDSDHGPGEFVTTHDFDPPPAPTDTVRLTGHFTQAPDGRILVLGAIS